MFRFFRALAQLTANTEALAASMAEANVNFRASLGLDDAPPEALPGPTDAAEGNGEGKGGRNGRKATVGR